MFSFQNFQTANFVGSQVQLFKLSWSLCCALVKLSSKIIFQDVVSILSSYHFSFTLPESEIYLFLT